MIEEFAAILRCSLDSTAVIVLSDLEMQFPDKLVAFFNMPPDDIFMYAHNLRTISLSFLITAYGTRDRNSTAWIRTVSFYLYAQFLLVSSHGDADTRIISILEQVEAGANLVPIILAEIIIELDNFKTQNRLSSSLLLLQVCN